MSSPSGIDPPPVLPPRPPPTGPHSFFSKSAKAAAAAGPLAASSTSASTSTSTAGPSSAPTSATMPPAKKRKPKGAVVDPKQGQLSFASGSGLGVVVPPPVAPELDKPARKGKGKAKAKDGEEAEIDEMAGTKKKKVPAGTKKGGNKKGVAQDTAGGGDQDASAAPEPASGSLASGSPSSSTLPPKPSATASSSSSPSVPTINRPTARSLNHPSKRTTVARLGSPDPAYISGPPSAVPSPLRMTGSPSKTESVDLTQDDSDEDDHPVVARPRASLKLKRGKASKQTTLKIGSSSDSEIEAFDPPPSQPKLKGSPKAFKSGSPVVGADEAGEEEMLASGSSPKGKRPTKAAKNFSLFDKRAKKTADPSSDPQTGLNGRARLPRSPSVIDLDKSSPVKRSSAANPIIITSSSQPSSSKPVHSFFSKRKPSAHAGAASGDGGGQSSKMVKATPPMEPRWPTKDEAHVGFSWEGCSRDVKGKGRERQVAQGRYDPSDFSESSPFWDSAFSFDGPPSTAQRLQTLLSLHRQLPTTLDALSSESNPAPLQQTIPPLLLAHPAFARLLSTSGQHQPPQPPSRHPDELWADKYKPRAAAEVLGNEVEAVYLRDWLVALELQGKARELAHVERDDEQPSRAGGGKAKSTVIPSKRKQPPTDEPTQRREIIRKVVKPKREKKRKSRHGYGEGEWIANSSEEDADEGDPILSDFDSDEDGLAPLQDPHDAQQPSSQPHPSVAPAEAPYPPLDQLLTNSILLLGPSGSGKTASVYACAAELGWEVFEVYPGVGKRSGTALASLVGDMSKNHIVGGGTGGASSVGGRKGAGDPGKSTNAFSMLMKGKGPSVGGATKTDAIPLDVEEDSTRSPTPLLSPVKPSAALVEPAKVRQSLILIEEVDILFHEEDKGFWQGLIALIAESRRPVVMTCNNLLTVPLMELPLQTILEYSPPPSHLAVPYLELVARAQGFSPSPTSIAHIYTTTAVHHTPGSGMIDIVGHPVPSEESEAGSDLRRAIAAMQIGCCRGEPSESVNSIQSPGEVVNAFEREGGECEVAIMDWSSGGRQSSSQLMDVDSASYVDNSSLQILDAIASLTDHLSFLTAHVDIRTSTLMDVEEIDRYEPSPDDEAGYDLLSKWKVDPVDGPAVLAGTGRERAMAVEGAVLAREAFDASVVTGRMGKDSQRGWTEIEMREARATHLSTLLTFLSPLIAPPTPLLPSPALLLDYSPYVRHLVATDDLLLASESSAPSRLKRPSARAALVALAAGRTGAQGLAEDPVGGGMGGGGGRWGAYQRYFVGLDEEELKAVRESGLVW